MKLTDELLSKIKLTNEKVRKCNLTETPKQQEKLQEQEQIYILRTF